MKIRYYKTLILQECFGEVHMENPVWYIKARKGSNSRGNALTLTANGRVPNHTVSDSRYP